MSEATVAGPSVSITEDSHLSPNFVWRRPLRDFRLYEATGPTWT